MQLHVEHPVSKAVFQEPLERFQRVTPVRSSQLKESTGDSQIPVTGIIQSEQRKKLYVSSRQSSFWTFWLFAKAIWVSKNDFDCDKNLEIHESSGVFHWNMIYDGKIQIQSWAVESEVVFAARSVSFFVRDVIIFTPLESVDSIFFFFILLLPCFQLNPMLFPHNSKICKMYATYYKLHLVQLAFQQFVNCTRQHIFSL